MQLSLFLTIKQYDFIYLVFFSRIQNKKQNRQQIQYCNNQIMRQEGKSVQRQFYKATLLQKLTKIRQQFICEYIYLEERAQKILQNILSKSEIFGTGLTNLITKLTIQQKDINKVVIVAVLDQQGQAEIQKVLHLFANVSIVNLIISTQQLVKAMKVSPIRKKLRGFIEISLNFNPYIDRIYTANISDSRKVRFIQAFSSYLTSFPKFHQYLINFSKTTNNNSLCTSLEEALNRKLNILERHQSTQYKLSSSPRVKILLIDRKMDAMSPLAYSYYYGAVFNQLQLLKGNTQFTTKSLLFDSLFSMDIQQSSEFLIKLSQQKATNKKDTLQSLDIDKMKKAITMCCDQNYSSKQIEIHIEALTSIKQFCKRRAITTTLQQTIINNRSQNDEKMSPSKIIDRIIQWAALPIEQYQPSQQDYIKMLILSYMVNNFWFFHRKIINSGLQGNRKQQIISYCKKVQNTYKPLQQKKQGQQRYDLYRHQPAIMKEINDWISQNKQFEQKAINKSSANRQSKYIIAIDGALGFNQACFILRLLKQRQPKLDFTIFCQRLVTTKDYLKLLLPLSH